MSNVRQMRKPTPTKVEDVDQRLRDAFPEINLDEIAEKSMVFNAHNLSEKWGSTVRQIQWWLDLSKQQ